MAKRRIEKKMEFILAEQKSLVTAEPGIVIAKPDISFDQWWEQKRQELKLKDSLKIAVYKHMSARGFLDNKEYDSGLQDFGIRS